MNINAEAKKCLSAGSLILMLAVMIGAFGAHGLKDMVTAKYLETYKTGVTYHFYHGFALLILGLIKNQIPELNSKLAFKYFVAGIFLFSFNCYFYALTQIKFFAMIVPLGGLSFIVGWALLSTEFLRKK